MSMSVPECVFLCASVWLSRCLSLSLALRFMRVCVCAGLSVFPYVCACVWVCVWARLHPRVCLCVSACDSARPCAVGAFVCVPGWPGVLLCTFVCVCVGGCVFLSIRLSVLPSARLFVCPVCACVSALMVYDSLSVSLCVCVPVCDRVICAVSLSVFCACMPVLSVFLSVCLFVRVCVCVFRWVKWAVVRVLCVDRVLCVRPHAPTCVLCVCMLSCMWGFGSICGALSMCV